jgi:5-methylcytosine-specific restriction endonuclease McrA
MSSQTLVLTPWMSPHRVTGWFDAVCLVYTGKARLLEEYEETVSSPSVTLNIPAVVQLQRAVGHHKKAVKFSRINVFTRDHFCCQYCGTKKGMRELNYDHVIPRDQGGKTVWENIVAACYPCNGSKANKTPEQAKMKLLKHPVRPKTLPMSQPVFLSDETPAEWRPYLEAAGVLLTG